MKKLKELIRSFFPSLPWAATILMSAKSGENVNTLLKTILLVAEQRNIKIPDEKLMEILSKAKDNFFLKSKKMKLPKLLSLKQIRTAPPAFNLKVGKNDKIPLPFVRIIEKKIREKYPFMGTPITINIIR
jgi:GTP-binding protein